MSEFLPGNMAERLTELRIERSLTKVAVAEFLEMDRSTYSKIEKGEIKTIGSDKIIKLAKKYGVNSDYILGLSDIPYVSYDDLGKLGLTEVAAINMKTRKIDMRVINYLFVNEKFILVVRYLADYFSGITHQLIKSNNALIDCLGSFYQDLASSSDADNVLPASQIKKDLNASKIAAAPYNLDKICKIFKQSIIEVKELVEKEQLEYAAQNGIETDSAIMTQDIFKQMLADLSPDNLTDEEKITTLSDTIASLVSVFDGYDSTDPRCFDAMVEELFIKTGNCKEDTIDS